ncbi:hypothetical protein P4O66_017212 [Electrophorus voltai]|uniref:Uncharacterized protein n=1 Tax=Electrophorus voltai TaxID=2609070 RepID=A0AAD8YTV3_9TELE|nr:hypothetical protein P4O66_017212 [Electrophorus voltai]
MGKDTDELTTPLAFKRRNTKTLPYYTLHTSITRTGCESSKLCASKPSTCNPAGNFTCFFASFKLSFRTLFFELSGTTSGFVALGLATNQTLGPSIVFVCANNNNSFLFLTANYTNSTAGLTPVNESSVISVQGAVSGNQSIVQCTFNTTTNLTNVASTVPYYMTFYQGNYSGVPDPVFSFNTSFNLANPTSNTTATPTTASTQSTTKGGSNSLVSSGMHGSPLLSQWLSHNPPSQVLSLALRNTSQPVPSMKDTAQPIPVPMSHARPVLAPHTTPDPVAMPLDLPDLPLLNATVPPDLPYPLPHFQTLFCPTPVSASVPSSCAVLSVRVVAPETPAPVSASVSSISVFLLLFLPPGLLLFLLLLQKIVYIELETLGAAKQKRSQTCIHSVNQNSVKLQGLDTESLSCLVLQCVMVSELITTNDMTTASREDNITSRV